MDDVCNSIQDILNLDSPGIYSDPIFCDQSPMELELEERDELLQTPPLILLDSPAALSPPSAPAPTPATDTASLHPFGATDIRTMSADELAARKKAKKAQKKKRSKEAKKLKKTQMDSETQMDSD